jgi:Zn-dependent protease with chaperone function
MRPALLVFLYAVAVAWYVPPLLVRLTAQGISARLGLATWLTAMASVLASLAVALFFLVRAAIVGWSGLAAAVCRSVTGGACTPTVYRSAAFELTLAIAATAAALTAAALAWRYGHSVQRSQQRTRAHAEVARITGRRLSCANANADADANADAEADASTGRGAGEAVVLDARQPVAYCIAGRPATIVLTSGALAVLDPAQLTAVLAHERAHLAGHHHLVTSLTRGLAASFPGVPLFTRGPAEVARLAEMCADDAATRHIDRRTLVAALLAMGTGTPVPAAALAATGYAITARVQRLLEPPRRARQARYRVALITAIFLLALVSGLIATFAAPLATHGITAG